MNYNSYWNANHSYNSCEDDISVWDFKDYKEYVYFKIPERFVEKNGAKDRFAYGRIRKSDGERQILFYQNDGILNHLPLGNFTLFGDKLYTWFWDENQDDVYIIGDFNLKNNKASFIGKLKGVDCVWLVLKNPNGDLIILGSKNGAYFVRNMKNGRIQTLFGVEDMEVSMVGYNDRYIYYCIFGDAFQDITYYCIDTETFEIVNISDELRDIIVGREVYLIDCRTDIIYLKNGDETKELISVDRMSRSVKGVIVPSLPPDEKADGGWEFLFNGVYWLGLHELHENFNRPAGSVVRFGENGQVIDQDTHVFYEFESRPTVLFSFWNTACVWKQCMDQNRGYYDCAEVFYTGNDELSCVNKSLFIREH